MNKETKKKAIIAAVAGTVVAGGVGYTLYKRTKKGSKKRAILIPKEEVKIEKKSVEKKPKVNLLKNKKNK